MNHVYENLESEPRREITHRPICEESRDELRLGIVPDLKQEHIYNINRAFAVSKEVIPSHPGGRDY